MAAVAPGTRSGMSLTLDDVRSIVLGYSRIGYRLRSRWWDADDPKLESTGKRVLGTLGREGNS